MRREEILLIAESALGAWNSARNLASMIKTQAYVEDLQVEVRCSGRGIECPVCQPHVD